MLRRLRKSLGLLLLLTATRAACIVGCHTRAEAVASGQADAELRARLAYLTRRLTAPDAHLAMLAPPGEQMRGEWHLVSLSMTGLAAANLAFSGALPRTEAAARVCDLARRAQAPEVRAFDRQRWGEDPLTSLDGPHAHLGYLGHLHLLLGTCALLGGEVDAHLAQAIAEAQARRMAASGRGGYLETYPGELFTADNAVSVAALALHDLAHGTDHRAVLQRWVAHSRQALDPRTGLLAWSLDGRGHGLGPGRGSAAGWDAIYLPLIDEAFAREQYQALRQHLVRPLPLGGAGIAEFAEGVGGEGDVDSGPILLGTSPAATGFALAGARRWGDLALLDRMLLTAEAAGTSVGLSERRYLLAPLVGDASVLAGLTATRWDRRFLEARASR